MQPQIIVRIWICKLPIISIFFLFILEMSEVISETGANTTLDELMKIVLDCAQCIDKNEDLSEMAVNNGLKEELEKANEKVNTNGNKVYVFQD